MAGWPGLRRWQPTRRKAAWSAGALIVLTAGALGLFFALKPPTVEPPTVSTVGLEPAVIRSIEQARAAVQKTPRSASAWGQFGMVLLAAQFPDAADPCFVQAGRLDPKEPRWPFFRALVLGLRDANAAIGPMQRAVDLCRDRLDTPRLKLAELLVEQGRKQEAQGQYAQLLRHRSDHPLAHLGLARLAYERADFRDCYRHLRSCLHSPFARKAAHTLLATVAARQHDAHTAEHEQGIVAQLPDDESWPDPYSQEIARCRVDRRARLAVIADQLAQDQRTEAAVALEKLVRDEPDFDVAWQQLGFVRMQEKDFSRAEAALSQALKCNPQCAGTHYYLGCTLFNEGRQTQAADHFRQAVVLKPDYAMALLSLGQCLKAQGDRAGAILALRQAVASRPYLASAHRDLAELLLAVNQPAEARQHLHEAARLEPADPKTARLLKTLPEVK